MPHFLDRLLGKGKGRESRPSDDVPPPQWTAAPEQSYESGKYSDATTERYESGERFFVVQSRLDPPPRFLKLDTAAPMSSKHWRMEFPKSPSAKGRVGSIFVTRNPTGMTKIVTKKKCEDTCIFSNLPIMAGLYDIVGQKGVYYEVVIKEMIGVIAIGNPDSLPLRKLTTSSLLTRLTIGSACLPYPNWRFPGWHQLSVGFHLDDFRKFFEDSGGGQDYDVSVASLEKISPGDSIGFGYEFESKSVFYTYNDKRLPTAFMGVYVPRDCYDVYAAIGVEGENEFEVNFGTVPFKWKEGNQNAWKVENHVGVAETSPPRYDGVPE